jgi:hypothetical protein
MIRAILLGCAGAVACVLPVGCADYPESRAQRPVYSHQNVKMGQADSGQEYRTEGIENKELAPPQR